MKETWKNMLQYTAMITASCWVIEKVLNNDHARLAEQRRRMGLQHKGPDAQFDENGYERWRHIDHRPDPLVLHALKTRPPPPEPLTRKEGWDEDRGRGGT